ncbi:haloacid dehalogenase [Enterococcus saigonensis]|uniref:Haloacid dehalogenase n=1 Tax=Enterococcus saigonensis TaxID=1805431 RepID=A0A679ILG1_9ENTE|nr:Cof-type HAD-IIB family hydrolase [Enterococcus saigonensis]BCA86106.1 haloacid dehalogenase [Enterococcus saigonensis]
MTHKAIAFFDLDGTLLDDKSQVRPEIKVAMTQLKENNVLPVIATGRTEVEVAAIMKEANIDSDIIMNGAFIRVDGTVIFSDLYDKNLIEEVYSAARENNDAISFYNEKEIWCNEHNKFLLGAYNFIHTPVPPVNPDGYLTKPVNMLLILGQDNDNYYASKFPQLNFYRNTPFSLDTVKKTVSKGIAVKILQEKLGLTKVPSYAFGDGPNDLALFEACDIKIAMGNAVASLKEQADFITKKNTEGGIVHALKHFELI